jgi:hypothetical protein
MTLAVQLIWLRRVELTETCLLDLAVLEGWTSSGVRVSSMPDSRISVLGFSVSGLGFGVFEFSGLGFGVFGFRVFGFGISGFRGLGFGFRVFRFQAFGFRVSGHLV